MPSLDKLQVGSSVVYFTGESLARARLDGPVELADIAWRLALTGRVDLAQVRLPDGQLAYRATRRHRVDKCPAKAILSDAPSFRRRKAA